MFSLGQNQIGKLRKNLCPKELKIELRNKLYVEKITFKTLNTQFLRKNFHI